MQDPKIITYAKPLSSEERVDIAPISFKDHQYVLAMKVQSYSASETNVSDGIPPEVGSFQAMLRTKEGQNINIEFESCRDVLSQDTIDKTVKNDGPIVEGQFNPDRTKCLRPSNLTRTGQFFDAIDSQGD